MIDFKKLLEDPPKIERVSPATLGEFKTIIAGSRSINDYGLLLRAIETAPWPAIIEVVSGGARGVDRMGERWAGENGVPVKRFIPKWDALGKRAGMVRNEDMVHYADALIALWDGESRGTRQIISYARKLGQPVHVVHPDDFRSVFVFGSNRQGRHGKGAALHAAQEHGAVYGQAEGLQGNSYAIITKELRRDYPPVTLAEIADGVERFKDFASEHPSWQFNVAAIGCGLAGFKCAEIAPMFWGHTRNVHLPEEFVNVIHPR